jgi:hypothetical protein
MISAILCIGVKGVFASWVLKVIQRRVTVFSIGHERILEDAVTLQRLLSAWVTYNDLRHHISFCKVLTARHRA